MSVAIRDEQMAVDLAEPKAGQRMTADEFELLPKFAHKYELIGGVVVMAPAGLYHDEVALNLGSEIRRYLSTRRIGRAYGSSTGFRLEEDNVVSPDVSFVALERLPDGRSPDAFARFASDLAVEVVSPSDRADVIEEKVQLYLSHGTKLVWVINPRVKTATIYRVNGAINRIQAEDELDGEYVLPGFKCKLSDIL